MNVEDLVRREQICENLLTLEKSKIEASIRKKWYSSHCFGCSRTWNECSCGTVKLQHFNGICLCEECVQQCLNGLPEAMTERFCEAYDLYDQRYALWKCNNGRLWILSSKIPDELRTEAMEREHFYGYGIVK